MTGKPGMLQSTGSQRVRHSLATEYHQHGGDSDNGDDDDYSWAPGLSAPLPDGVGKDEATSLVVREPKLCDKLGRIVLLVGEVCPTPLHWTFGGGGDPEFCVH